MNLVCPLYNFTWVITLSRGREFVLFYEKADVMGTEHVLRVSDWRRKGNSAAIVVLKEKI